jgi:hypothetical protein
MLYGENLPETLTHAQVVAAGSPATLDGQHRPGNDTDRVSGVVPVDSVTFDRLHNTVYEQVKPETHGERRFLTQCIQAVLSAEGQWTEAETKRVLNVLLESREGVKVMFQQVEFTNDGFPDSQVA